MELVTRRIGWTFLIFTLALRVAGAGTAPEKVGPPATPVEIDILPGEERNLVDPGALDTVTVAVLGSATLDVQSILPESLRLGGAPIVKDASGGTHAVRDVNGDGRLDLIVGFAARQIQLSDADASAVLEGTTVGGVRVRGLDKIQTVAAALASAVDLSQAREQKLSEEKLTPLVVSIELLEGDPARGSVPVAILAGETFDPASLALGSIRVDERPITKMSNGELASVKDVNGDGRDDLVVAVPDAVLHGERLALSAVTDKGRIVTGGAVVEKPEPEPLTVSPMSSSAGPVLDARYPYVIFINDLAPADHYPASVTLSGVHGVVSKVRVTLNGLIHPCFNDLDVMLVAPNGQSLVLMSDVGGCGAPLNATTLTFDDFAPTALSPGASPAAMGSYRPANSGADDTFPSPAPAPSGAAALSAFSGIDPNGEWKLYIVDDAAGGSGQIRDGWTLDVLTMTHICNTTPIAIPDSGAGAPYPSSISVSGVLPSIVKATVTLDGLTHTFADDLDVMLAAPGTPTPVMLMSDAGGAFPLSNVQLTFDDDAGILGDNVAITASTAYHPADYEPGDVLPAPAPATAPSTNLRAFRGTNANGTWSLYVSDDAGGDQGTIARGWCLNLTTIASAETCQTFPVTIPEGAPGATSGPAAPYPLYMNVTGASGIPTSAEIKLVGLSHTFPDDLDILVQTPLGKTFMLMSDAGGAGDVNGLDVVFSTSAGSPVPDGGPLGSGPYLPTDFEAGDTFPSPAPAGPYATSFPVTPANGPWTLYVQDDASADVGELAGGWCLNLKLDQPGVYCSAGPLALVPSPAMTIPQGAPGTTLGPAYPYGSRVYVPEDGVVPGRIRVQLNGLTHTFPADLDVLLVGPQGQKVILMSDAGAGTDVSNLSFTLDDVAAAPLSSSALSFGTFQPTNYASDTDNFPAPAPPGPYSSSLSAFSQIDPQGYWDLYVVDDATSDVGSWASWCLEILQLYPPAEVPNLRFSGKTVLEWDSAPNVTEYSLFRGTPAVLRNVLTADPDACAIATVSEQRLSGVATDPPPGSFFWYLILGRTWGSPYGPAGFARIGSVETARTVGGGLAGCGVP